MCGQQPAEFPSGTERCWPLFFTTRAPNAQPNPKRKQQCLQPAYVWTPFIKGSFRSCRRSVAMADGHGVTRAHMESFYEAAEYYFRKAPWSRVPGEVPIEIRCDDPLMGTRFAVVLGRTGVQLGLCIYDDWEASRYTLVLASTFILAAKSLLANLLFTAASTKIRFPRLPTHFAVTAPLEPGF